MTTASATSVRGAGRRARRAVWRTVHLWLGLSLGVPLALFGITGSVLVFWEEIDAVLNPQWYALEGDIEGRATLGESMAAAMDAAPPGWSSIWMPTPSTDREALPFHFFYDGERGRELDVEALNVFVDPRDASVIGSRVFYHAWNPFGHCFVGFFFKLHYAFLLGDLGMLVVGIMGAVLLISTVTGLVLWWPANGHWRRVLTLKRGAGAERLNHDVHQLTGFYTLLVMLAVLVSGIYFNLPAEFQWLVERFSPVTAVPPSGSGVSASASAYDAALGAGSAHYAGAPLASVTVGDADEAYFQACYEDIAALRRYVVDLGCLTLDRATAAIVDVKDPSVGTGGDVFIQWQWPLHSGQAFGWTGRLLVFVLGLACPLIVVTGFIRWLQKQRAKGAVRGRNRTARLGIPSVVSRTGL